MSVPQQRFGTASDTACEERNHSVTVAQGNVERASVVRCSGQVDSLATGWVIGRETWREERRDSIRTPDPGSMGMM